MEKSQNKYGNRFMDRSLYYHMIKGKLFALVNKDKIVRKLLEDQSIKGRKDNDNVRYFEEEDLRKIVDCAISPVQRCLLWLAFDIGEINALALTDGQFTMPVDQSPFGAQPFHNTGLYNEDGAGSYPKTDMGLYSVTFNKQDMGKFRAPTLRNIALTAPYMHDGSIATLEDVIAFYARGGNEAQSPNPYRSPFIKGFSISEKEKAALVAFLQSLTDEEFVEKHVSRKNK